MKQCGSLVGVKPTQIITVYFSNSFLSLCLQEDDFSPFHREKRGFQNLSFVCERVSSLKSEIRVCRLSFFSTLALPNCYVYSTSYLLLDLFNIVFKNLLFGLIVFISTSLCFLSTAELPQRSLLNLTRLSHFHSLLHSSKVWFFCCWEVSFAMGISDLLTDKSHEHFSVPTTFLSNLSQLIASIFLKAFFPLDVLDSLLAVSWVLFFPNM